MLYVHLKNLTLISSIRTKTKEGQDPNIVKEVLMSKQFEMGIQNPTVVLEIIFLSAHEMIIVLNSYLVHL